MSEPLSLTYAVRPPDLALAGLEPDAGAVSGRPLTIRFGVTNVGVGPAVSDNGYWHDRLTLSSNTTPAGVIASWTWVHYGSVYPGAGYRQTNSVTLPVLPTGTYYLIAQADTFDRVPEEVETNNFSESVALAVTAPDLVASSLTPDTTVVSEQSLTIRFRVRNVGNGPAISDNGYWHDRVVLSSNATPAGIIASWNCVRYGSVDPGADYWRTNTVTLPELAKGTYYLLVQADFYNVVSEEVETNNTSAPVALNLELPDLAVSSIVAPAVAVAAEPIPLVVTITNGGNAAAAGPWSAAVNVAANTNGDGKSVIGTFNFTNTIAVASSVMVTQTVILPGTAAGTRYLGVFVDQRDEVFESDESNNTAYATNPTVVAAPDLVVAQVSAPGTAEFGQTLSVEFAVTNIGSAPAGAAWKDQLYLGAASNSLSGATPLATVNGTSPLEGGNGYARTLAVMPPISADRPSGLFYIIVVAVSGNAQV